MKKTLTISVAAYNGAATLERALDSCVVSQMDALEVFVVDDGSSDQTAAIAAGYEERYPETFHLLRQQNKGYGSTINKTLKAAAGVYYRTLDCDDWFSPGALDAFLSYLKTCSTDIVYTNYQTFVKDSVDEMFDVCRGHDTGKVFLWDDLEQPSCMEMHAMTFRTEKLRDANVTLPEHCCYTDMLYTFCGVKKSQTVSFCPIQMYCYLLGQPGQSVSPDSYRKHLDEYIRVAELICEQTRASVEGTKETILLQRAAAVSQEVVELILRMPKNPDHREKLVRFDSMIRQRFPKIAAEMRSKNTWLLRKSGYALYGSLCLYKSLKDA